MKNERKIELFQCFNGVEFISNKIHNNKKNDNKFMEFEIARLKIILKK